MITQRRLRDGKRIQVFNVILQLAKFMKICKLFLSFVISRKSITMLFFNSYDAQIITVLEFIVVKYELEKEEFMWRIIPYACRV